MPNAAIEAYLARLPDRLSELRSLMVEASSWPHMSTKDRRAAEREWQRRISRKPRSKRIPVQLLPLVGIGVEYV